ncbi:hypothetical protein [Pseudoxanthomonas sp. 3HH-4]|uniref:hypothetical protein n=1 Tax=Pseudoxanthomonas sp. 3HH-4 TaxID=1690214 RepID=UPI00114E7CAF|nr:hypothetical protein [Pseudoxanthomonas sp. 3HH-4]
MFPRAVLLGGAVAGTLDILYAFAFWCMQGIPPVKILQSVAAGWLGREAFTGGGASALLGAVSHYGIALVMAWTFYQAARRVPALERHPLPYGALYGVLLYAVMTYVVVPLSAAGEGAWPAWQWQQLAHVVAHAVLVGIPCALAARWVLARHD